MSRVSILSLVLRNKSVNLQSSALPLCHTIYSAVFLALGFFWVSLFFVFMSLEWLLFISGVLMSMINLLWLSSPGAGFSVVNVCVPQPLLASQIIIFRQKIHLGIFC